MYIAVIKRSVIIFLIAGCSPDNKTNNIDNNALNEMTIVDESLLAKERQEKFELLDRKLQLSVTSQNRANENQLLQDATSIQDKTESQLLKKQKVETWLAEEALLESAKNRANVLITQ